MARLMIVGKWSAKTGPTTRIGGLPVATKGTPWPRCATCKGLMQFLAQIALQDARLESLADRKQLLLLFQCQNDPGVCDEWDADAGGNAAILVTASDLDVLSPPAPTAKERNQGRDGPTSLDKAQAISARSYDDSRRDEYDDDADVEAVQKKGTGVVGKLGGRPVWIQGDETPKCSCGRKMAFIAQIEAHADRGINFGDAGAGYAFACKRCKTKAKFLWQCS
jgi:uncharacterized protein YwqG